MARQRERKNDRNTVRNAAVGLMARLYREKLTHAEYLTAREVEVFRREAWKRVSGTFQLEILAYMNGAIDAAHFAGLIVWCHRDEAGNLRPAKERRDWNYQILDPNASRHCWREGLKVWFEPSAEGRLPSHESEVCA